MIGPGWLRIAVAVVMVAIVAFSILRLTLGRLRGHSAEPEADALHVLMGTSMAGMLDPKLSLLPAVAWVAVFTGATAWFAWNSLRARVTNRRRTWQCANPAPHAIESAAMVYMLWPEQPGRNSAAMAMPGMSGHAANPALALVLALFMVGYILWTADRLASGSRARATDTAARPALVPRIAACSKIVMSAAMGYMLLATL